jgi:alkanesulfonate monooxygenase SsuD/methylene tetrahydromethanopterin reductase-like flavin-dependent oxidoreductase (luciferase family)
MNAQSAALPSYQGALARGGARNPEDVALIGDEEHVRAELARLAGLGVTEFNAVCTPIPEEPQALERTHELLADVARAQR